MEVKSTPPPKDPSAAPLKIRLVNHDICRLCGQPGDVLYRDLTDRLFSVPRAWNFRRCRNAACRLVWLDPQPAEEDFPLIYEDYGTHGGAPDSNGGGKDTQGDTKGEGGVGGGENRAKEFPSQQKTKKQ